MPVPARSELAFAALAAAAPAIAAGIAANPGLRDGILINPDSAMRLARMADIAAAGTPLHAVAHDGATGTVLHWSHLLDSLLLLLAAPLAPFLGQHAAVHLAGLASGPLAMAALGAALAWATLPLAGRGTAVFAGAAAGLAPSIAGYGLLGVVHHHILLAVLPALAAGWALRILRAETPPRPGGIALGAAAACGLWLSPETLPFTLAPLCALWLAWLLNPARPLATAIAAAGSTFALLVIAALLADPPATGLAASEPDRLSFPFALLAAGAAAAGLAAAASADRRIAAALALGSAAAWLAAFPAVLRGSEGLVPPEVVAAMFDKIEEMQPVRGLGEATETLLPGLFAAATLLAALGRTRRHAPAVAFTLLCALAATALAAAHVRFGTYAGAMGAALLPVAVTWITGAVSPARQPLARLALVLPVVLLPALAPMLAPSPAQAATGQPAAAIARGGCSLAGAVRLLRPFGDATVLSGPNEAPFLLYGTGIRTVGSLFHRGTDGFMRLQAAWRESPGPGGPGPALRATAATLLLACPGAGRSSLVADLPRGTTLLDRVDANMPPPWLHRIGQDGAGPGGFVLYAIEP